MLKTVQLIIPSDQTDRIIEELRSLQGLIGLQLQRDGSIYPPGDIITAEVMNRSVPQLVRMLEAEGLGHDKQMSMKTMEPLSLVSSGIAPQLEKDTTDATWEEMETLIRNEANANVNNLVLMAIAGAVAGIGLSTGALHLVIGGMVIAPGFEPFSRLSLGFVSRRVAWLQGLLAISTGYLSLIGGALVVALLLYAIGISPIDGRSTYHASSDLISYWTSLSVPSVLVSSAASVAGGVVIAINRPVLTIGPMIALALIPTSSLIGLGLAALEWDIIARAALRWLVDAGLVTGFTALVFMWKRTMIQRRSALS